MPQSIIDLINQNFKFSNNNYPQLPKESMDKNFFEFFNENIKLDRTSGTSEVITLCPKMRKDWLVHTGDCKQNATKAAKSTP